MTTKHYLLKPLLLLITLIGTIIPAMAYNFCVDGIYYNKNGTEATVTYAVYGSASYSGDVVIPSTVTYEGTTYTVTYISYAFRECTGLTSVTIPNSVTGIGMEAFYGCTGLTSVTIPNSVTGIGMRAFRNCIGLTSVTIPSSVTSIGDYAFEGCKGLTSVTIPSSVTSIKSGPFSGCTSLTAITVNGSNANYCSVNGVLFNKNKTTLIQYPAGKTTTSYTIPSSVTSIGNQAFGSCSSLTSVTIPSSVTSIGKIAFFGCTSLTSVNVPDGVTSIGDYTFYKCSDLTSVTIPSSVTSIGKSAFFECTSLTSVNIPNGVTTIGDGAFSDCTSLTSVNIPNGVTTIGDYSFYHCTSLASVDIPSSVTSIGQWALAYCTSLTSVNIPNGVTTIGYYSFYHCTSLASVDIPNGVTTIGDYSFYQCTSLASVDIPNSVTTIGDVAFADCTSLTSVTCEATTPPSLKYYSFSSSTYQKAPLYVPVESVEAYKTTAYWSRFNKIFGIGTTIATGIELDKASVSLAEGETAQLTATITPNDVTVTTVNWTSNDESIATVDQNGKVTAVAAGSATITATTTDGTDFSASCKVTVKVKALSISLNKTSASIYTGNTTQLSATVLPSNATDKSVTWKSSNTSVATVSSSGLVTGVAAGTATITATTADGSNLSATCKVTVTVKATSISLDQTSASIDIGKTTQLSATVLPSNATDKSVTWKSSKTSVATVSSSGLVTGIAGGTATITATTADGSNLSATCKVTVKVKATSISLDQSTASIYAGNTTQLSATVLPSNATDKSVTWKSSNTSVATVSSSGLVTGVAAGTATITATTADGSNLSATCEVTVKVQATSISLNKTSASIYAGNSTQLSATVLPSNTTDKSVTWQSSNTSVATVSSSGLVKGVAAGTATITATTADGSDLSATCKITVSNVKATSIVLNKTSLSLYAEDTEQLTATLKPTNTTIKTITWSSSDERVATVSDEGVVTAISVGSATITASTVDGSNVSATCAVTVNPTLASSIQLDYSSVVLTRNDSKQLTATVLPTTTTNKAVTWSSADTTTAKVDANGVVLAVNKGTTTITATAADGSGATATCQVTVNLPIDYDNYIIIDSLTTLHSDTIQIPVRMVNAESITAFQTDIYLPKGLTLLKDENGYLVTESSRMTRSHTIMSSMQSSQVIRVLSYSASNKAFRENDGDLFYLTVSVSDNYDVDYEIKITNTKLTNMELEELYPADTTGIVSVTYLLGDANGNKVVNIADVVLVARYILNLTARPFYFKPADVNKDNTISITDAAQIVNIILHPNTKMPRRAPEATTANANMSCGGVTTDEDGSHSITIDLDNDAPITAFQLDLRLPQGATANNFKLSSRADDHILAINTLDNGAVRVLCLSNTLSAFDGQEGALLTFDVNGVENGNITVEKIETVTTSCNTVMADAFTIDFNQATAMNEVGAVGDITSTRYYNLQGVYLGTDKPSDTGIYLEVISHADGSTTTSKFTIR